MDLNLTGRRVIVTGGSSGIGRSAALAFAAEGARVGIISRDRAGIETTLNLAAAAGFSLDSAEADITDEAGFGRALDALVTALGGLDSLVHCAAISGPVGRSLADVQVDEIRHTVDVNIVGAFIVAKVGLPHLARSKDATFVMIGSDSAFVASPDMVVYNATKAAIVHMARSLAVEWEASGIRVNTVSPSIVDTPMSRGDLGLEDTGFVGVDFPVLDAADVARSVLFLSSTASRGVNGHSLTMDFGYSAKSAFPA
jgi:NAD(P)-dependent dehydrogenase (short-subunit alcohol dehydrogenase family)